MKGEIVIVRALGGKPLVRRVWDVVEKAVLITTDSQFQLLLKGDSYAVGPIGFPKEDVFKFDPKIADSISGSSCSKFDWGRLQNWTEA